MSKCKHKRLVSVSANIFELEPDQEPFESGVFEAMDTIDNLGITLWGHWCPKCEILVDIGIEEQ